LLSETKSSAGDKHETGRAMAQLEREKLGQQLVEINKIKQTLNRVKTIKTTNIVTIGSLVYTNQFNYYIAISAGEFIVNNNSFYAVSPNTPIGKLLIGKTIGDIILFKNKRINIIDVV
jgi:transcription elongation GreA/GreB family factor